MKGDGFGEREAPWEFAEDLRGSHDGAFLGLERGESLRELCVAIALARVGCGEKLLGGSEFGRELSAVATVGAPGLNGGGANNSGGEKSPEFECGS